jgi:WD40 repeat protein
MVQDLFPSSWASRRVSHRREGAMKLRISVTLSSGWLFGMGLMAALALMAPVGAAADQPQTLVLLAGGINNIVIGQTAVLLATAELFNSRSGQFTATGSMATGRTGHGAILLGNGNVLVTGGDGEATDLAINSAELYDVASGAFTVTGSMTNARVNHTMTLLNNGKVLVTGGQDSNFINLASAELYDPVSGTFQATGSMSVPRVGQSATLLPDGTVLIAGGGNSTGLLATAEIYDPATGNFDVTGSMSIPRELPSATLLKNGQVLIAGGVTSTGNCGGCSTPLAELYDPRSHMFELTGSMNTGRRGHTATLLTNGKVLVTGGIDDDTGNLLRSAELYNPGNQTFRSTGAMLDTRFDHSATLLYNGLVLIAGGFDTRFHVTDTAEIYNPNGIFAETGNMTDARAEQTATGLASFPNFSKTLTWRPLH